MLEMNITGNLSSPITANFIDLIFEPQTLGGTPLISDIANRLLRFRVVGTIDEPEITIRKVKKEDL